MKKLFALIMGVMVLGFSVIPCSDNMSLFGHEDTCAELSKSIPQEQDQDDACSPFCICTCCAGFSVTCTTSNLSEIVTSFIQDHNTFIVATLHSIALPIWQPPQLIA